MRGVTYRVLDCSKIVVTFQLTRLMRGVTGILFSFFLILGFQLTRLMRGVTYSQSVEADIV